MATTHNLTHSQQHEASAAAAPKKGPLVWLDMDQTELDNAYDQSKYAPNHRQVLKRYAMSSEATRQRIGAPQRLIYGSAPIEGMDLYIADGRNAPIHVFIHGGAWRAGEAKDHAFPAEMFVDARVHYLAVDYNNVLETGGSLLLMADQVRRAVAWVYRHATEFGGDPERIFVSGHSSGAHLAGVVLATDWQKDFGLPAGVVKGGLCVSGMYDLKAVRLSGRSSYVKFTDEMEDALSSQRHLDKVNAPVIVAYGSLETPEFQRQACEFASALQAAGKQVRLIRAEGYNHFEIAETLGNPYGVLGRAVLELMTLTEPATK